MNNEIQDIYCFFFTVKMAVSYKIPRETIFGWNSISKSSSQKILSVNLSKPIKCHFIFYLTKVWSIKKNLVFRAILKYLRNQIRSQSFKKEKLSRLEFSSILCERTSNSYFMHLDFPNYSIIPVHTKRNWRVDNSKKLIKIHLASFRTLATRKITNFDYT